MSDPIIIIGAGPAGLSTAYKILKESGKKVVVIDKAPAVGGAGASFKWKGNILDYGPHAFHTRGDKAEQLIRSLFKDDKESLLEGRKNVYVYLKNKKFKYPLQVSEALLKFNPFLSIKIISEFILTSIFHAIVSIPIDSFENWGRKRFGATLYRMSFGDYTEKVWKTKAAKISEKFASEKIQGFNFIDLIKRLLKVGGQVTDEPYFQTWIYHKYGSGELFKRMSEKVTGMGGEILLNTSIKSVELKDHNIQSVTISDKEDNLTKVPCGYLVNTIPLPQFIGLFNNELPFILRHSASKLSYISLIVVYIEFNIEKISDSSWFYLLDKHFKFNRVTEQKNLSPFTIEDGKTILSFELTCREGDEFWQLSDEELFAIAKEDCKKIDFIDLDNISDFIVKRVPDAYEMYYKNFDKHADLIFSYLRELKNCVSIGRRGLFLQGDMHQSVAMGLHMGEILADENPGNKNVQEFYSKYLKYIE
ncbi:MAG: FAD-dependent oxidoreductase [Nitrospirae bacterium]|nr:FAD-dependent oxidoreductase [Nitrospirota bacterium]